MPLYICNAKPNTLDASSKQKIANDITSIHCGVTGAPAMFVHVVFFEESPLIPLEDKKLIARGTIRKGRSDTQKLKISQDISAALIQHAQLAPDQADAHIGETPASWVMEGGEIMLEPGEEDAWFARREQTEA